MGRNVYYSASMPSYRRDTTYSAFLQYDVILAPDKLRLIAGSKFEHNPYTGFEYQPQVRAVWTPNKQNTLWAAASRAVRTPNRIDEGLLDRIDADQSYRLRLRNSCFTPAIRVWIPKSSTPTRWDTGTSGSRNSRSMRLPTTTITMAWTASVRPGRRSSIHRHSLSTFLYT